MYSTKELISEVREIANQRPDVVYKKTGPNCSYVTGKTSDGQSEGCIFGLAMRNMGINITDLKCGSYSSAGTVEETAIWNVLEANFHSETREEEQWCEWVQNEQDTGIAWRKAVISADEQFSV